VTNQKLFYLFLSYIKLKQLYLNWIGNTSALGSYWKEKNRVSPFPFLDWLFNHLQRD